ncbi:conserved exported hypothetical protein [Verrucomicrobia bacterium]|nr:conserved exported hypothetical protein [Verrucomicrobiota bacterium]
MLMKTKWFLAIAGLLGAATLSAHAGVRFGFSFGLPLPVPVVPIVAPAPMVTVPPVVVAPSVYPVPGYSWAPGYWSVGAYGRVWVPGCWHCRSGRVGYGRPYGWYR